MRVVILAAMLFLFLVPTNAMALSCVEPPSIDKAYEQYDGLIIGQVVDITRNKDNNQVELKVVKSYKGIEENSLTVDENITWGSLWGPSEIGQEYLFFLRQTESGWENPLCSPTKKVADASVELEYLQDKEIPLKKDSSAIEPDPVSNFNTVSVSDDKGMVDRPPTNWLLILSIVCLALVAGYVIYRFIKRAKQG